MLQESPYVPSKRPWPLDPGSGRTLLALFCLSVPDVKSRDLQPSLTCRAAGRAVGDAEEEEIDQHKGSEGPPHSISALGAHRNAVLGCSEQKRGQERAVVPCWEAAAHQSSWCRRHTSYGRAVRRPSTASSLSVAQHPLAVRQLEVSGSVRQGCRPMYASPWSL